MTLPQPTEMYTARGGRIKPGQLLRHPQHPGGMIVVRIEHGDKCVVTGPNGLRKAYDAAFMLKTTVVVDVPSGAPTKLNAGQHITNGYDRWIICGARYLDDSPYKAIQYSLRNHSKSNEIGWHTEDDLYNFRVETKSVLPIWVGAWVCDFITGTVAYVVNINDRDAKTTVLVRGMHKEHGLYTEIRDLNQICTLNDWVDKPWSDVATKTGRFDSSKPHSRLRDIEDNPKPKKQLTDTEFFFPKPAPDPVFHKAKPEYKPRFAVGQKVEVIKTGLVMQVMEYLSLDLGYTVVSCALGPESEQRYPEAHLRAWQPKKPPCPDPKASGSMRIALKK